MGINSYRRINAAISEYNNKGTEGCMAIKIVRRERVTNEDTVQRLMQMSETSVESRLLTKVQQQAAALAASMADLHGRPYRVSIATDVRLVMVIPERNQEGRARPR